MAAGVPVIAAAHGGVLEIIEPDRSGILVRPADEAGLAAALESLSHNEKLRRELAEGARRRAADFSLDTTVEQIQQVYAGLLHLNGEAKAKVESHGMPRRNAD
jgi:glycosyltransferase involved in cell wall biosynthesis